MSEQPEQPKDREDVASTNDGTAALIVLAAGGLLYAAYKGLRAITSQRATPSQWEECRLYIDTQRHTVATQGVVIGGVPYYDRSSGPSYTESYVIVRMTKPDSREIYRSGGILNDTGWSVRDEVESTVRNLQAEGWELSEHDNDRYSYHFRRRIR